MRQPVRLNAIASPSIGQVKPAPGPRVRRPRPRFRPSWRDTRVTDSGALRAILAGVAVVLIAIVLYLVSLSSHPGIEQIQPGPHTETLPGPIMVSALVRASHPIEHVTLNIDGRQVLPAVAPQGDRTWKLSYETVFPRGTHRADLTVVDNTGAVQQHEWTFSSAGPKISPAIAFAGPPAGLEYPAGPIRLHAVVQSGTPLKTVDLTINGAAVSVKPVARNSTNSADPVTAYDITLKRSFAPGAYVVQLSVSDQLDLTAQGEWALTVVANQSQASAVYDSETDSFLYGAFKQFWQDHGGQKIFGAPVSDQYVDSTGTVVQYFANARFELRPDGSVGLGRLGAESFHQDVPRVDNPNSPNVRYFEATGHTLQGAFQDYWNANGGLAIFGYPISEVLDEDGTKVQYFERARFELAPSGNSSQPSVQLTPLGSEMWNAIQSSLAVKP